MLKIAKKINIREKWRDFIEYEYNYNMVQRKSGIFFSSTMVPDNFNESSDGIFHLESRNDAIQEKTVSNAILLGQ